ncbi:hypothetical protein AVEN_139787-1, partial [Araneus ventricosus]
SGTPQSKPRCCCHPDEQVLLSKHDKKADEDADCLIVKALALGPTHPSVV